MDAIDDVKPQLPNIEKNLVLAAVWYALGAITVFWAAFLATSEWFGDRPIVSPAFFAIGYVLFSVGAFRAHAFGINETILDRQFGWIAVGLLLYCWNLSRCMP